jgi:hypothetical protein
MSDSIVKSAQITSTPALQFFYNKSGLFCFRKYSFGLSNSSLRIVNLFLNLEDLSELQKKTLIMRYISITENIRFRAKLYTTFFHIGRAAITIGSLIVPALLSIQNAGSNANSDYTNMIVYWITWAVSLLVTTSNGIMTLFKIDKKYFFLHTTLEQLKSEAYQYINLSGKYGGFYTKGKFLPDHSNQYIFFSTNMERIKLKQVEEEYYKLIEDYSAHTSDHHHTDLSGNKINVDKITAGLYNPTPNLNIEQCTQENKSESENIHGLKNILIVDGSQKKPQDAAQSYEKRPQQDNTQKKKILVERRQSSPTKPFVLPMR